MSTVRFLVADDHELVRRGLVALIERTNPNWKVVAEAAHGRGAIEMAEAFRPDVAILDLQMPAVDGIAVTRHLVKRLPGIKVLLLTVHAAEPVRRLAERAGALGLLAKNEAPDKLAAALEMTMADVPFFASESAFRPVAELGANERVPVQFLLTPRKVEVLRHLALGMSNKEVGVALGMSERTVQTHRLAITRRLSVDSLGELTRLAVRDGLL